MSTRHSTTPATGDPAILSDRQVTILDSALAWTIDDLEKLTNWTPLQTLRHPYRPAHLSRNATGVVLAVQTVLTIISGRLYSENRMSCAQD